MTSLSLICEYGSSSSEDEGDDIVEVMEIVEVKEKQQQQQKDDEPSAKAPATLFGADILSVVESLISRVERRHQHHYQNNHHHQQYPFPTSKYRTPKEDDESNIDDSTSSDSDSDISIWSAFSEDDDDDEYGDENFDGNNTSKINGKGQLRSKPKHCVTKGELTVDDLPPIERLQISVDVRCLTQVGIVCSMVNQLVVVQSFKSVPVLDLDTVFFCREGTSIGQVFDVIGPVKQPNYVLRFNSPEEAVVDCKLSLNAPVYYAEEGAQQLQKPDSLTRYVFVQQLEREKGCDASWKHNNEPPPEEVDYSDDEVERGERWRKKRAPKRPRGFGGVASGAAL